MKKCKLKIHLAKAQEMKRIDNMKFIKMEELACIMLFLLCSNGGQAKVFEKSRIDVCCFNNTFEDDVRSNTREYSVKEWINYELANAFTLSVPNTVELRNKNDLYSQEVRDIRWHGYRINLDNIVFQQKGLAMNSPEAFETYCRILVNYEKGNTGDFYKATEYEEFGAEGIFYLQKSVKQGNEAAGNKIIGEPGVCWIKIGNIYALEIEYVRSGTEDNPVQVYTYSFFNNDETVTLTLSYWVEDREKWEKDFQNLVRTFAWNKLK
ncbi:hypothetical protein B5F34_05135 [Mediterranea sp. An20]|nr:hypothetical protein B5F34_05135 [Mediterranea sp. An20]